MTTFKKKKTYNSFEKRFYFYVVCRKENRKERREETNEKWCVNFCYRTDMLGISLSARFLLTFMDSVVEKISTFCCIHPVLLTVYLKVHQMPHPRRQFSWRERAGGVTCHCRHYRALEWHQGPWRLLCWHPPQVLVFLQGIVLKFYDCHYWPGKKGRSSQGISA